MTREDCCRKARACKEVKTKALKEKALELYEDYGLPDSTCPDFGKHGSG